MVYIKEITTQQTYLVRHPILRAGKPLETCHFENDESATTKHFGLFNQSELIGVASLFEKNNLLFSANKQVQLRGMAVL